MQSKKPLAKMEKDKPRYVNVSKTFVTMQERSDFGKYYWPNPTDFRNMRAQLRNKYHSLRVGASSLDYEHVYHETGQMFSL